MIFKIFDKVSVYVTCLFKVAETVCVTTHPTVLPFVNTEKIKREMQGRDNPTNSETHIEEGRQTDRETKRKIERKKER